MEVVDCFIYLIVFVSLAIGCATLGEYGIDNDIPVLDYGMVVPFVVFFALSILALVKFIVIFLSL